jgi:hypothetical protein
LQLAQAAGRLWKLLRTSALLLCPYLLWLHCRPGNSPRFVPEGCSCCQSFLHPSRVR